MRTDFAFFEPHQYARRRPGAPQPVAHLLSDARGRFTFNQAASQLLGLEERTARVALGNSQSDLSEWVLMRVETGGFEVGYISGPCSSGYRTRGFRSQPLREHLVATLPFADSSQSLTFKLDKFSCATEGNGEAWLLLTAPYCHPPKPAELVPEKLSRALLMTAPPGLLGVLRQVDVPQL